MAKNKHERRSITGSSEKVPMSPWRNTAKRKTGMRSEGIWDNRRFLIARTLGEGLRTLCVKKR